MGLQIREIIPKSAVSAVSLDSFKGTVVAVDAFNALYQFLATIRQQDGTPLMDSAGKVTSHLSGIFYRNIRLLEAGARIVYVFDGKAGAEKAETIRKREETKKKAEEKYEAAVEEGDLESARKYAQATSRLDTQMIEEAKSLLKAMGIPVVNAPSEGESQASFLAKEGKANFAASQDYDCLLFGAPILVRNLSATSRRRAPGGKYVEVPIEAIELAKVLEGLKLDREQLVALGILVGTDYNPGGIKGIGPKKALNLIESEKTFERIFKQVSDKWTFGITPEEIRELFLNPKVDSSVEIGEETLDSAKIKEILCGKHEFSAERIDSSLSKLQSIVSESKKQKGLNEWF
ncbi:MAG: flap endonuclease-1 [archaeon]